MDASVSVFERMDVHESERQSCRHHDGIHARPPGAFTVLHDAPHHLGEVAVTRAHMLRNGRPCRPVPSPDPSALGAQAESDEPPVSDQSFLQSQEFLDGETATPSLANRPAPTQSPVVRGPLSFQSERSPAVLEQEKGSRPPHDIGVCPADDLSRAVVQFHGHEAVEFGGPPDERAEPPGARQVVANTVPPRERAARGRKLPLRVDDRHGPHLARVRNIEAHPRQPFIEEPDAPGVGSRGLVANNAHDILGIDHREESREHTQAHTFPLQRELEVPLQALIRSVTRREHPPFGRGRGVVSLSDRRQA